MSNGAIHAERRTPEQPEGSLELGSAGRALLAEAEELAAGRAARTLTPHLGAGLKQTLLAIRAGRHLSEHRSPGEATLQVLEGAVTVRTHDDEQSVATGEWAVLPQRPHELEADADAVVLLTVHAVPST